MTGRILPLSFFRRPVAEVARDLLGAVVVSRVGGVLTSTLLTLFVLPALYLMVGRRTGRHDAPEPP